MKMYEMLSILDNVFTPDTTEFSDYVKWTSDDNGFLRTCFCKKSRVLRDRNIPKDCTHVIVGCDSEFNKADLICKWVDDPFEFMSTVLKMQICFTVKDKEAIEDEVDWNHGMGYKFCYLVDLRSKSIVDIFVDRKERFINLR